MGALRLTYKENYRPLKVVRGNFYLQKNSDAERYEFGFNGQLKDNEIYGEGNAYDLGARVYDSRNIRLFSRDPLAYSFPYYTPYQFAGNKLIACVDFLGRQDLEYSLKPERQAIRGGVVVLVIIQGNSVYNSNLGRLKLHNASTGTEVNFFPFASIPNQTTSDFDNLFRIDQVPYQRAKYFGSDPSDYFIQVNNDHPTLSGKYGRLDYLNSTPDKAGVRKFWHGYFEVFPIIPSENVSGSLGIVGSTDITVHSVQKAINNAINELTQRYEINTLAPLSEINSVKIQLPSDALKIYESKGASLQKDIQKVFPGASISINTVNSFDNGDGQFSIIAEGKPYDLEKF